VYATIFLEVACHLINPTSLLNLYLSSLTYASTKNCHQIDMIESVKFKLAVIFI
jgi:hypothetical protein